MNQKFTFILYFSDLQVTFSWRFGLLLLLLLFWFLFPAETHETNDSNWVSSWAHQYNLYYPLLNHDDLPFHTWHKYKGNNSKMLKSHQLQYVLLFALHCLKQWHKTVIVSMSRIIFDERYLEYCCNYIHHVSYC